jgi:hypothetical protein
MQLGHSDQPSRRKDRILGLLILCTTFAGCLGFSLWARDAAIHDPAPPPGPPTREFAGFPSDVRPFDVLPLAQKLSIRPLLQGFVAQGVKADGTMDFTKKQTALRFSFQSLPGRGPQPNRTGGTLPTRSYCGRQNVQVGRAGLATSPDHPEVSCPRQEPRALPVIESCDVRGVWKFAMKERGVPSKGTTAEIEYFWARLGPAYRFAAKDAKGKMQRFTLSARDCKTVLAGPDQRGSVPP